MAGTQPGFDATQFRDRIRFAYTMGAAPDPARQPYFVFPGQVTSPATLDSGGVPFDPDATITTTQDVRVQVPCGVQFYDNQGQPTAGLGIIHATRVVISVLDTEHALIEGCALVEIDGDVYHYRRTEPPGGLFDVGIFTLHFAAEDET